MNTAVAALLALSLVQARHGAPTGDGEVVAEFVVGGHSRTLTKADVALYLARRHRNSSSGKDATDHLIEVILVKAAAHQAGVMPTRDEVRTEIDGMRRALEQRRMDFDKILVQKHMSLVEFEEATALGIAQKRLVAKVLGVTPDRVTEQHIELWTREQRNKIAVETDPAKLSNGVLARVGTLGEVTDMDVGRVLLTRLDTERLGEAIRRIVFEQVVAHEAERNAVHVTREELEVDYAKRKAAFEKSGKNQGIPYEQWLAAFGRSKEQEIASPSVQTTLLHEKLVRKRYPPEVLDRYLREDGTELLRRHGIRRSMSILLVRATKTPNKILKRDFADALAHARALRSDILDKDKRHTFALMARVASDDPTTKQDGGDIGWQHASYLPNASGRRAPQEVLDAAFGLEIGAVSEPIATDHGYYLVWVSGEESEPDSKTLHARMLGEMAERYNKELFEAAKIVYRVPVTGAGSGAGK